MYNNYYQNAPYAQNRNEVYSQAVRLKLAQEYYKRVSFNNKIQIINPDRPYQNQVSISPSHNKENQKMLIVRHGERVDSYYGGAWIANSFNHNGEYVRKDANMPQNLIFRKNPYDFEFDPPLTENGLNQARLHGEELAKTGVHIKYMYCSPALRSIQTADKILEGMGLKEQVPIRIEIGLFELLSWQLYVPQKYPWIDKFTLKNFGYNIDMNYKSMIFYENLKRDENVFDYYQRSHYITKAIADLHPDEGNIMLVGHAPTLEGCSRLLTGEKMRNADEFTSIARRIPFLSIAHCEKDYQTGTWRLTPLLSSYEKYQRKRNSAIYSNQTVYRNQGVHV